jgi:hypothetical protein
MRFAGNDLWKESQKEYDYRLIYHRLQHLYNYHDTGDIHSMIDLLRAGVYFV